jgi:hypothetical protein
LEQLIEAVRQSGKESHRIDEVERELSVSVMQTGFHWLIASRQASG